MILFFRQWQSQDFGAWWDHLKNNSFLERQGRFNWQLQSKAGMDGKWENPYGGRAGGRGHQLKFSRKNWGLFLSKALTHKSTVKIRSHFSRERKCQIFYRTSNTFPRTNSILKWHTFNGLNQIQIIKLSQLLNKLFYFNSECVSIVNEEGREISKV